MCNYSEYIKDESKYDVAEKMLRNNEPLSKIELYTELTAQKIKDLAAQIGVAVVI